MNKLDELTQKRAEIIAHRNEPDPLVHIESEIEKIKADERAAQIAERANRLADYRERVGALEDKATQQIDALDETLVAIAGLESEACARLCTRIPSGLFSAMQVAREWRGRVESSKRTAEETRRVELQNDLARAVEFLAQLKDTRARASHNTHADFDARIKETERRIARIEARIAGKPEPQEAQNIFEKLWGAANG